MKRMFYALLFIGLVLSPISAQSAKDAPQPIGATRVAVVNVGYVFKHYEKAEQIRQDSRTALSTFAKSEEEVDKLSNQINRWQSAVERRDLSDASKEEYLKKIRTGMQQLDNSLKRRQLHGKKQQENLIELWKDVREAVRTYASQKGFQLVLGYGDPEEKEILDSFANVDRKKKAMDAGGTVPLFIGAGVDISQDVTTFLNERYRAQKAKSSK
jgi:Skp family chaperone for outer membrane proteins